MAASQTINSSFTLEGIGLHTGVASRVTLRPRNGGGRIFHCAGIEIPALVDYVSDTRRCVTLARNGVQVQTVEHLLAALSLLEIDHVGIEVSGPELPALDGSARAWYDAIRAAGVCPLSENAPVFCVVEPQWIDTGASQFFLCPAAETALYSAISIPNTVAERMMAGGNVANTAIREQIVRARTFALESELQALQEAGLARGGSLDNAVVLTRDGYQNANVWPLEPAWHKVLDLAGDLALSGVRLIGQVLAIRGGHHSHVELAQHVRSSWLAKTPPAG